MKATLKFTLPEERDEFTLASKGLDLWCVLLGIERKISTIYNNEEEGTWEAAVAKELTDCLYGLMEQYNVTLDMVS